MLIDTSRFRPLVAVRFLRTEFQNSENGRPMWRTSTLLLAVFVNLMFLAILTIPLGIPDEWIWLRQSLPTSFSETLDRLLFPGITSFALLAFCGFADGRITRASRTVQALLLIGLVVGAFTWLNVVRNAAATPHRELRPLWVLYDKYVSGYFFEAAFRTTSQKELLSTYEARMAKGDVLHEGTHPPGLFLLNWWALQATRQSEFLMRFSEWTQTDINARMFRNIESQVGMARPLTRTEFAALCLVSFASSLLAAMTALPLYALIRTLSDRQTAWRAACLMMTIPSLSVFAPRSDIVYAFSGTLILWLIVAAFVAESVLRQLAIAVTAGLVIFMSLTVSLAHLPVLFAGAVFGGLCLLGSDPKPWRRVLTTMATLLFVFLLLCAAWTWLTDCNILRVWKMNLSNHAAFYQQSPRTWWKWALVNPLELSFSVGLPLMVFSLAGLVRAMRTFRKQECHHSSGDSRFLRLVISLVATWGLLWLSGKNMGEAARLWCFLTPWVVITAALEFLPGTFRETIPGSAETMGSSQTRTQWLLLLCLQLAVCTATVGRVSGYHMFES